MIESNCSKDTSRDFLIIETPMTLSAGSIVILDIGYTGVITTETEGIFRGSYQQENQQR